MIMMMTMISLVTRMGQMLMMIDKVLVTVDRQFVSFRGFDVTIVIPANGSA